MDITPGTKTTEAAGAGIGTILSILASYNGQIPPLYAGAFVCIIFIAYITSRTIVKVTAIKNGNDTTGG